MFVRTKLILLVLFLLLLKGKQTLV